jgi:hypothetical protein
MGLPLQIIGFLLSVNSINKSSTKTMHINIDGQVCLVRLFVSSLTNGQLINFHLHHEQMIKTNEGKAPGLLFSCIYNGSIQIYISSIYTCINRHFHFPFPFAANKRKWQTSVCLLQTYLFRVASWVPK